MGDKPGLETRGYRPKPGERGPIARYIHTTMTDMIRKRMSIEVIHGNTWPGWFENGNPHGEPRPGPIAVLRGVLG